MGGIEMGGMWDRDRWGTVEPVTRRVAAWVLSLPLMLGGTEAAHWLAFRLAYPNPYERSQVLQQTGHGYFEWLPLVGGIGCAFLLSALVVHGRSAARGGGVAPTRLSRFASLPPLAFIVQEQLERLISSGTLLGVVLEPTFMLGVLLTLPFALVAYLAARLLLGVAERVGRVLRRGVTLRLPRLSALAGWVLADVSFAPRLPALAAGHGERGPPL